MFGSKNRRILDLEEANRHLNRRLASWENKWAKAEARIAALESSELALMGQIREMDTEIFAMTQKTDWESMRNPHFIRLQAWMEHRRNRESQRIAEALIPEMQKAYRHEQSSPPKHVFIRKYELARREYASRKALPHGRRIDPDRD